MQEAPEVVAWVREVGGRGRRDPAWVDAAEDDGEPGCEHVGHGARRSHVGRVRHVSIHMTILTRTTSTPIGRLRLVASLTGLQAVLWPGSERPDGAREGDSPILTETARQLDEYFAGARTAFSLPLELDGTPFQREAWLALADIPYGQTVTYAEQARRLGRPDAVRAIGAANGRNPVPIVLP